MQVCAFFFFIKVQIDILNRRRGGGGIFPTTYGWRRERGGGDGNASRSRSNNSPIYYMVGIELSTLINFLNFSIGIRRDGGEGILDDGRDPPICGDVGLLKSQNNHQGITFKGEGLEPQRASQLSCHEVWNSFAKIWIKLGVDLLNNFNDLLVRIIAPNNLGKEIVSNSNVEVDLEITNLGGSISLQWY